MTEAANQTGRVVIVGAGHAGDAVAGFLRQLGVTRPLMMLGEESEEPYHRPPVSKEMLKGEPPHRLRSPDFYREQEIDLRLGTRVVALDLPERAVRLADGAALCFDLLILATGASVRRLEVPGADLAGIHYLRSTADAAELHGLLTAGRRLAIVGGGYIGLEVAAAASAAGVEVTILEREPQLLARVASPRLSDYLAAHHRRAGVEIRTDAVVTGFAAAPDGSSVAAVELADGSAVECDAVLVSVGAVPNDRLAKDAGITCAGGIVVDEIGRVDGADGVYAVGDVTRRPVPDEDEPRRLESIPSTTEQARQVAAAIADATPPPAEVPWFWSNQADLKLQICGLRGEGDLAVVRGDPGSDKFAVFHTSDRQVRAVEAVNAPAAFVAGKNLIKGRVAIDAARLADDEVPLRDLVAQSKGG